MVPAADDDVVNPCKGCLAGTPTKRQVSKCQVLKRPVSKRLKRQVYKTSGLQNDRFTKCQVYKTSALQNIRFTKCQVYETLCLQNVRLQKSSI
jgi:hypothetical protein